MAEFINSQSEDLWSKAVASLKPELRELFSAEKVNRRDALEVLLYEAHAQRMLCIKKQWRITKKSGDIIILRDVFEKIIQCVDKFKMLGNTAAEFAPGYASVPWAVIKMLLQTSINDTTAFAAMIDGVEEVTSTIARCAIFEAVYMKEETSATEHLKSSLVSLYAAVLTFLGICCTYFSSKSFKRFMKATMEPAKEIEDALNRVRSMQKEIERTAQIASMEILQETSIRMHGLTAMVDGLFTQLEIANSRIATLNSPADNLEPIKKAIASIMGPTTRTIEKPHAFNDHLQIEQRAQVFDWLSPIRYASHHLTESKGRLSNSGEWLFNRSEFLSWTNSSISGTLWVHGVPGCGKTKLASAAIDFSLTRAAGQESTAAPMAYFYCSRNSAEAGRSEPTDVLRCIARQLSPDDPEIIINESLLHVWDHAGKPQPGQDKLDVESTMTLILKALENNPATIIIDALDELQADKRHELFDCLDQIVRQSPNVVKILLTSRNDGDIVCRLKTTPNIYISAQDNQTNIGRFIEIELDKTISQKRLLRGVVSADLRSRIVLTLNHGAQGMFRWVSLQIQNLCDPQRMKLEEDVLHELGQLPQSLFDLYKIAFDQICQLGPSSYEVALSTFQLLLVAIRPITWPEILHMLRVSHPSLQGGISREQLLDITCNFVDDDGEQKSPRFSHQSVREYLETRSDFAIGVSNAKAAHMCIHQISAQGNTNTRNFCYSSFYVANHLAATAPEQRIALIPLLQQLLLPQPSNTIQRLEPQSSDLFKKWRRRLQSFTNIGFLGPMKADSMENCIPAIVSVSPLAAICALGLDEILVMLKPPSLHVFSIISIPKFWCLNSQQELNIYREQNCFMLAIILSQPRIVRAVRNLGYSVDTPTTTGTTALSLAAEIGRANMVRELLICGANPNQTCQHMTEPYAEPLWEAKAIFSNPGETRRAATSMGFHTTRDGRREIQSPFDYKGERMTVLHLAMNNEQGAECVRALIEFGANVNTRTSTNVTPLEHCLEYGNLKIMFEVFSVLLKAGADSNALLGSGRTIAHVVAAMGHHELIGQLLDTGTNCSLKDMFQQTPLELAIRYGHAKTAELLESRYGASLARKAPEDSSLPFEAQYVLDQSYTPSIFIQDVGDTGLPPHLTELDHPPTVGQPVRWNLSPLENLEWNRIVNPRQSKKSMFRRSISSFLKKKTPSSGDITSSES